MEQLDDPNKLLKEHISEFKTQGFTVFPKTFDETWMQRAREIFEETVNRIPYQEDTPPTNLINLIEHVPHHTLQAITVPKILDFAEAIIGPYIQLESITYRRIPSITKAEAAKQSKGGYHRDMFAFFPDDDVYHRPLLFNAIVYLQDLTDETGPLRVIPGSHMQALSIPRENTTACPEEKIIYLKSGDVVMFHCSMLHAGSPNISGKPRYIYIITYNHSWLKYRGNYNGPNAQTIIEFARKEKNRRLLRLLGEDDLLFNRANSGYQLPDEQMWKRWIDEDRQYMEAHS